MNFHFKEPKPPIIDSDDDVDGGNEDIEAE